MTLCHSVLVALKRSIHSVAVPADSSDCGATRQFVCLIGMTNWT